MSNIFLTHKFHKFEIKRECENEEMLKTTFSKHWLNKISMTCSLKLKKWYNSNDYSYKWSLYGVVRWKLLFDGEATTFLVMEGVNLLRHVFLAGEMSKFWAIDFDSPLSSKFPIKV